MSIQMLSIAVRLTICTAIIAAITLVYRLAAHINPTTVALTLLVAVLVIAARWGLRYSIFAAVLATLAFNFNFLPPVGTFAIADPHNWVALVIFLATALVASDLSERARREADSANRRRREVERLYRFSQQLLVADDVAGLSNTLPAMIVNCFGGTAAAVYLTDTTSIFYSEVEARTVFDAQSLASASKQRQPIIDVPRSVGFVPLTLGTRAIGSLGLAGNTLSTQTLEAIGSLTAIAIEHAAAVEQVARMEAARESESLRSALLDSITHEFRTPLTGIKASVTTLLSQINLDPGERRELLTVIDEESDRLNRLVGDAAEMAQLDSQHVSLRQEWHHIKEAVDIALEEMKLPLASHPVQVCIDDGLPLVRIDLKRVTQVLKLLLDNAGKYSPAGTPIRITSHVEGESLKTSVADSGPGITEVEQTLIFEKFYRGRNVRTAVQGTGMGLSIARAIIDAHGGSIAVATQVGRGSAFSFVIPIS